MIDQLFDPKNTMAAVDMRSGRFLTASGIFRGRTLSTKEVEYGISNISKKKSANFVEWIPNNIKTSICSVTAR
jgi:tubulin beta